MVLRCRRSSVPRVEINRGHVLLTQRDLIRCLELLLETSGPTPLVLRISDTDADEVAALSGTVGEGVTGVKHGKVVDELNVANL